jgi:hypothetical protein
VYLGSIPSGVAKQQTKDYIMSNEVQMLPEGIDDYLVLYTEVNGIADVQNIVGYEAKPTAMTIAQSLKEMYDQDPELFEECYMIQLNREGIIGIFFGGEEPANG